MTYVLLGLGGWVILAALAAPLIGKSIKAGRGPEC